MEKAKRSKHKVHYRSLEIVLERVPPQNIWAHAVTEERLRQAAGSAKLFAAKKLRRLKVQHVDPKER